MYGNPTSPLTLTTYSGQRWLLAGTDGFFLQDVNTPQSLARFIHGLPIALSAGLLMAGLLAQRTRVGGQAILVILVSGVVVPLAACWMWGDGWLQALGKAAGLGNGAIDLGHIATVGLATGAAGVAWLRTAPKREPTPTTPEMPIAEFPIRAVAGVLCVLIASATFAQSSNQSNPVLSMAQFVNTSIVVSVSILTAGAYAIFATRKPDTLSAARAALASVFAASAGGAVLHVWALGALGVACGLLATLGYFHVNEKMKWADDNALVTSALLPSALGMLMFGLTGGLGSAVSLFAIQSIAVVTVAGMSFVATAGVLALATRLRVNLRLPTDIAITPDTSRVNKRGGHCLWRIYQHHVRDGRNLYTCSGCGIGPCNQLGQHSGWAGEICRPGAYANTAQIAIAGVVAAQGGRRSATCSTQGCLSLSR